MARARRSEVSKAAWRSRKRAGAPHTCAFCGKGIWARGVFKDGRWWHRAHYVRQQVEKARKAVAT